MEKKLLVLDHLMASWSGLEVGRVCPLGSRRRGGGLQGERLRRHCGLLARIMCVLCACVVVVTWYHGWMRKRLFIDVQHKWLIRASQI